MQIRSAKVTLVLLLAICAGSALSAWAQSTSTGTVAGSVVDPTGALVSGAEVTLTDTTTNVARSTTTNATGRYIYVDVNPGIYTSQSAKRDLKPQDREPGGKSRSQPNGQPVSAGGRRECGGGGDNRRHRTADHECHRRKHHYESYYGQPAEPWPRCQHLHRVAAGREPRWLRCGDGCGSKYFLAGWRRQHQRHGWQHERLHQELRWRSERRRG